MPAFAILIIRQKNSPKRCNNSFLFTFNYLFYERIIIDLCITSGSMKENNFAQF